MADKWRQRDWIPTMVSDENEYLDSLKQADSYHFSIPFEYIEKNYGNDNYDIATTNMEVDATWSDSQHGYVITHNTPEMYLVNPAEGNGNEEEFFEWTVSFQVRDLLSSMGIGPEAIVI